MTDFRSLLAVILGVGLGIVFIAYPEAIVRIQTVGRVPHDMGGEYGTESSTPTRWLRLVQALGVLALLIGLYLGITLVMG